MFGRTAKHSWRPTERSKRTIASALPCNANTTKTTHYILFRNPSIWDDILSTNLLSFRSEQKVSSVLAWWKGQRTYNSSVASLLVNRDNVILSCLISSWAWSVSSSAFAFSCIFFSLAEDDWPQRSQTMIVGCLHFAIVSNSFISSCIVSTSSAHGLIFASFLMPRNYANLVINM